MKQRLFWTLILIALVAPVGAQTQQPAPPQTVDRIYAVVGDSIIFESEVREELERSLEVLRARRATVPTDSATLARMRREILDQLIDRLILVQEALKDSTLVINDADLNAEVEKDIEASRARVGGQAQFDAALQQQRMTFSQYREGRLIELRKDVLGQRYLQRKTVLLKPPPISEKELKEEFEKAKASLPPRPPTVTFQQVVMLPTASDSARARARAKADSLLMQLRTGADFATLAKRHSDDPGTRDLGGDLGWARPSTWVQEFAEAVMFLRPGEVSPPVETSYGFHIIKLERVRGAERQVRHILIAPAPSPDDAERAVVRGREIADKVRAGAKVDSLHRAVGDVSELSQVGPIERTRLAEHSAVYAENLANAKPGDVVGPFAIGEGTQRKVVVVKVTQVHEGGEYTFNDPTLNFRRQIQQRRQIAEILEDLRRKTHIEIRQ